MRISIGVIREIAFRDPGQFRLLEIRRAPATQFLSMAASMFDANANSKRYFPNTDVTRANVRESRGRFPSIVNGSR